MMRPRRWDSAEVASVIFGLLTLAFLISSLVSCAPVTWQGGPGETCRNEMIGPPRKTCDLVTCWTASGPLRIVAETCRDTQRLDEGSETL